MTVTGTKLTNRDIYEIRYDQGEGEAIVATMTNPDNGDVSQYKGADDGVFTVTVKAGYEGEADYSIADASGNEIDSGHVVYGAAAPEGPEPPEVPQGPVDPEYGIDEGAHPDIGGPGDQPKPDQTLPEGQPHPDQTLPEPEGEGA